jgi:hypothetical protein
MSSSSNGGDCGFGYSQSGNATANARFVHCSAGYDGLTTNGDQAFGITQGDSGYVGLFSGNAHGCEIGNTAFGGATVDGDGVFSGHAESCRCTTPSTGNAFGFSLGAGNASCQGSLTDCRVEGYSGVCFGASSGTGEVAVSFVEMTNCYSGGGKAFGYALEGNVTIDAAQFYDCMSMDNASPPLLGRYSFGYSGSGSVINGGKHFSCVSGSNSFGCTDSVIGNGASFAGFAYDCLVQDSSGYGYCFGSAMQPGAGPGVCDGMLTDCIAMGDYCFGCSYSSASCVAALRNCSAASHSFGYAVGGNASFAGRASDCTAGNYSFGACSGISTGIGNEAYCESVIEKCQAGTHSFGYCGATDDFGISRGVFAAWGVQLQAGEWSYGSGDGFSRGDFIGELYDSVSSGGYCFGASQNESGICGGGLSTCVIRCEALLGRSFGYTESTTGAGAECTAEARDCVSGDYSFGCSLGTGGGHGICTGNMKGCRSGISSFGHSVSDTGSCSGIKEECVASNYSFGYGDPGDCSGSYYRCRAGNSSFGSGGTCICNMAILDDCIAGYNSFGSDGGFEGSVARRCTAKGGSFGQTGSGGSVLEDCTVGDIDSTNLPPTMLDNNLVRKSRFVSLDPLVAALMIGAAGVRLYDSEFIGDASGVSVDSSSPVNVAMVHCRMNVGVGLNVTNIVGSPLNVVDPAVI